MAWARSRPDVDDEVINAYCNALKNEYVNERENAVGDFFDSRLGQSIDDCSPFDDVEEEIKTFKESGRDVKREIEAVRNRWIDEGDDAEDESGDDAPFEDDAPFMGEPVKLEVTVLGAIDLPNVESLGGKNDPYCKVVMGGEVVFKTSVDNNTIDPAWGESGKFKWDGFNDLIFIIMDNDFWTSDDFIAQYIAPKEKLVKGVKGSFPLQVNPKLYQEGINQAQITIKIAEAELGCCGCW